MGPDGTPTNHFVQIDMTGLPQKYLDEASRTEPEKVEGDLRGRVFEIENSLAMYGLLKGIHSDGGEMSMFDGRFNASLEALREHFSKPIVLLATTHEKDEAMRTSEFGKEPGEDLTDEKIKKISGFDTYFGPDDFRKHIEENGGESQYLLYVRSSAPVSKLRDPSAPVDEPLLGDEEMRRVIKAHTITMNVDNPDWPEYDPRRINDTKAYMEPMEMGAVLENPEDVTAENLRKLVGQAKDDEPQLVRAKPLQGAYGCYGHVSCDPGRGRDRQRIRKGIKDRGPYVVQREMPTPTIHNPKDGEGYAYIDRNFMSTMPNGEVVFVGGFRSLMPTKSEEAKKGRIHGSSSTVWAEIA